MVKATPHRIASHFLWKNTGACSLWWRENEGKKKKKKKTTTGHINYIEIPVTVQYTASHFYFRYSTTWPHQFHTHTYIHTARHARTHTHTHTARCAQTHTHTHTEATKQCKIHNSVMVISMVNTCTSHFTAMISLLPNLQMRWIEK